MNIIVASHGPLAAALVESASMFAGEIKEKVPTLSLTPDMSMTDLMAQASELLDSLEGETLAFVDLFGGTPSNVLSALTRKYDTLDVITGASLPLLIEAYTKVSINPDYDKKQLIEELVALGKETVVHTNELLGQ